MAGTTRYFTTKNFTLEGVFDEFGLEYTINNLVYRKSASLEFHKLTEVFNICKEYNDFGINILVVRGKEHLTIWIEDKSKSYRSKNEEINNKQTVVPHSQSVSTNEVVKKYRGQEYEGEKIIISNHQSVPTKKVVKKYRGRVYEEEVVDWSKMQPINQQNKPPRKYRGQYID